MIQQATKSCGACGGCSGCGDPSGKKEPRCGGGCCGGCGGNREITITEAERDFLLLLGQIPFLPLARFHGKDGPTGQPEAETLAPVYLNFKDDPPETVRETGLVLRALEAKRLITLDYDKPLQNGDYSIFEESDVFKDFCRLLNVKGGASPEIDFGSIALTALGQSALDSL